VVEEAITKKLIKKIEIIAYEQIFKKQEKMKIANGTKANSTKYAKKKIHMIILLINLSKF
jgi:hypothetical protein